MWDGTWVKAILREQHHSLGCFWSHISFPQCCFTTNTAHPMFLPGPSDSFSFSKWNKVLVAHILSFLQRAQLAYSNKQLGRWFDGFFQTTSRSQEMGWEASCRTGLAGFRCLGKYEGKASFVGKSKEEDLVQQPQVRGWSQQQDTDPSHRAISRRWRVAPGGWAAAPCLGQEGSVAGGGSGTKPSWSGGARVASN